MYSISKSLAVLTAMSIIFFIGTSAPALDSTSSYQCDGGIVVIGSSENQVKQMCGEPSKIERMGEENLLTWIYDSGDTEFIYYVSFLSGKVYRIQMGDYGD